jgi:rod shape-determining protein MreC
MVVYRRDTRRRYVLALLVITSLVLISLDSGGSGVIGSLRSGARDVIAPVQNLVDDAFSPVRNWVNDVTDAGKLRSENEALRKQIDTLQGQVNRDKAVGSQAGELEKLLDLPTIEDATGVAARVIGGAAGNFQRTVEIDRGTGSGIDVGMPVVTGAGLVGIVQEASHSRATIRLIDDPGTTGGGVGVRTENARVQGIAVARAGDRLLHLSFIEDPAHADIKKGELVFTSATKDAAYPPDIAVAKVVSIDRRNGDLEPDVALEPVVDLDRLVFVKVLRWPETGGSGGGSTGNSGGSGSSSSSKG